MKRVRRIASILILISASATALRAERQTTQAKTEELVGGRWVQVDTTSSSTQPTSDPTLTRVEDLINAGHYSEAFKIDVEWLKANRTHGLRDRALYLAAEALYRYGDRIKAFYYLDELMDEYPDSRLFSVALEKQYQIADAFLNGYKSRFLYMPIVGREDEAIEMLYRIRQRSPGSALAEKALLRTADHYYENADYDLAGDAYAAYVKSYPRSPKVPQVKLKQAFANLAQFRGLRFDATPVVDARAQLTEIIATYPELAQEQNLQEIIQRIDGTFARKLFVTADFYRRTNQPIAAVYTYRFLINAYPDSPESAKARDDLQKMPAWALETPQPGRGPIALPSTQPSASAE
jgi:outer membrane assembly lipoprotein YfiO